MRLVPSNIFKPSSISADRSKAVHLLWIFFVVYFYCVSVIMSCLVLAALWSPAGEGLLFALLYVMFSCVFVTSPYGVLGQVWYLIVLIHALCLLSYFVLNYSSEGKACSSLGINSRRISTWLSFLKLQMAVKSLDSVKSLHKTLLMKHLTRHLKLVRSRDICSWVQKNYTL